MHFSFPLHVVILKELRLLWKKINKIHLLLSLKFPCLIFGDGCCPKWAIVTQKITNNETYKVLFLISQQLPQQAFMEKERYSILQCSCKTKLRNHQNKSLLQIPRYIFRIGSLSIAYTIKKT